MPAPKSKPRLHSWNGHRRVEPALLYKEDRNPWLYFYEDFLAAYDKKLRGNRGVYYTPVQSSAQHPLARKLLEVRFGKTVGVRGRQRLLLDPAAGTCAYPLAAIAHALDKVEKRLGKGAVPSKASQLANNVPPFEILVGPMPWAICAWPEDRAAGGDCRKTHPRYLTDTWIGPRRDAAAKSLLETAHGRTSPRANSTAGSDHGLPRQPAYNRESYDPAEMEANPEPPA